MSLCCPGFRCWAGHRKRCGRRMRAPRRPRSCRHWASTVRIADPEPLRVQAIQRRRIGRSGVRADDVRARSGAAEHAGGRGPGRPGEGGGAPVPAPRWPEAVAGMGARRRSGRHRRPGAVADRTHPSPAGVQRRDAGAARPRLPTSRMAGLPGHGSARQRRRHDARGVGGASRRQMGAAAGQRGCGVRDFDGHPGGRAGVAPGAARSTRLGCTPRSWD